MARSLPLATSLCLLGLLLLAGCRPSNAPPSSTASTPAGAEHRKIPSTKPPADVSHGEAKIGGAEAEARAPDLPPLEAGTVHRIAIDITDKEITIAPGVTYRAWTFAGSVPGPFLHVRQGHTVDFTLTNRGTMQHSMDFHAAEIAPSKYYVNVDPGKSIHYTFEARVPGAFMYHCGTAPVAMHIANGMYGALIVDPAKPRPPARELVFVQSEFYFDEGAGPKSLDWNRLLTLSPDYVVFNGRASQYATKPIEVQPGELLRLYVVNAGPNRISSFHVVGGIFEHVYEDASATAPLTGVQTVDVPVGGGAISSCGSASRATTRS